MVLAEPWQTLVLQALDAQAGNAEAGYAQLASVRADGTPACRTVRPRWLERPAQLVITTDGRSAKTDELGARPHVELCWYFPHTRQQFRLAGQARLIDSGADRSDAALRARAWRELSPAARQMFTWPPPGSPLSTPLEFSCEPPVDAPPEFAALVVTVSAVDYLDLRMQPHVRLRAEAGGHWRWRAVNP